MDKTRWANAIPSMAGNLVVGYLEAALDLKPELADQLTSSIALNKGLDSYNQQEFSLADISDHWHIIDQHFTNVNCGIELAKSFNLNRFGAIRYLVTSAADATAAFNILNRYVALICSQMNRLVNVDDNVTFILNQNQSLAFHPQFEVFLLTLLRRLIEFALGQEIACVSLSLSHDRIKEIKQISDYWRCSIRTGQAYCKFEFRKAVLVMPVTNADPFLHDLIRQNADQALATFAADEKISDRVVVLIRKNIDTGRIGIKNISDLLNMSVRSLQRMLEQEDVEFKELVDNVRMELADNFLIASSLNINQISNRLGYSQPSSFNRWFKKHTGLSPEQYKRRGVISE